LRRFGTLGRLRAGIGHIPVVQDKIAFLDMRVLVQVVNTVGIEHRGPPFDAVVSVQHISSVGIITEKNVLFLARGGKTGATVPSPACFQHEGINFPAALKQKSGAGLFPAHVICSGKLMKWTATLLNL
jgi:hypothetical protein